VISIERQVRQGRKPGSNFQEDQMNTQRGPMPVAFFGIAVGLLALANAWHVAVQIWPLPAGIADTLTVAALGVWVAVSVAYAYKWFAYRDEALAEL
jgi:tellurite resistance protein